MSIATPKGYRKLQLDSLVTWEGKERERAVEPTEWYEVLEEQFGLRYA